MTERDPKGARESFDAFKELVTRFPDSKYTPDALLRMKYLVNALASLELHVARYYMKRGAYLAAANRAQYAVMNYPEAPATEEALFIMVKAYDSLGLPICATTPNASCARTSRTANTICAASIAGAVVETLVGLPPAASAEATGARCVATLPIASDRLLDGQHSLIAQGFQQGQFLFGDDDLAGQCAVGIDHGHRIALDAKRKDDESLGATALRNHSGMRAAIFGSLVSLIRISTPLASAA
jgi:hypothetical protein